MSECHNTMRRVATEEEKREFISERVDERLIGEKDSTGSEALTLRIGRTVYVTMKEDDKQRLLDRLMKIPDTDKAMVWHTINDLVYKSDTPTLSTKEIELLRNPVKNPTVNVHFKHFTAPSEKEGGWYACSMSQPSMSLWSSFFKKYEPFILCGSRNCQNVKRATEENLPIDVGFMRCGTEVMRFIVFEPYPENQVGFNMYVTPVTKEEKEQQQQDDDKLVSKNVDQW